MEYLIYKITNTRNGKIYIGYHKTNDINDGYMGSGNILKLAMHLEGKDAFAKEILHRYKTKEEALAKEKELVNEEFVNRDDTYNLKVGGEGGWDHTHNNPEIIERRRAGNRKAIKEGRNIGWKAQTEEQRSALFKGENNGFYGKKHSKESKLKIGASKKIDEDILNSRIQDYLNEPKTWGWKGRLGKAWGITGQAAARFIRDNNLENFA